LNKRINNVFSVKVRSLAARKMCEYERAYAGLYLERLSFKKHINYLKLSVNEHVYITHFHDFPAQKKSLKAFYKKVTKKG